MHFVAEATRNSAGAQQLFQHSLSAAGPGAEWMKSWLAAFNPGGAAPAPDLGEGVEAWYRTLGLVPRQRYLDLLDRYEQLRKRLEEAEARLADLQGLLARSATPPAEAQQLLDLWRTTLQDTLHTQAEWMRAFAPPSADTASPDTAPPAS